MGCGILAVAMVLMSGSARAGETGHLETAVCGWKEPLYFWLWQRAAGRPDPDRVTGLEGLEDVSFRTVDGRTLRGYRLRASRGPGPSGQPRGFLLVAGGNAMLADQILHAFVPFSRQGIDVYLYDYRGYGRSEGKSRLEAIVSDYRALASSLSSGPYDKHLYYGMSFGGIVLLNALDGVDPEARLVVDSSPSALSTHGCPERFDPVRHADRDPASWMFVTGARDRVVPPGDSAALANAARAQGALLFRDPEMNHPFMDFDPEVHERRMNAVRSFLLRGRLPAAGPD